MPFVRTIFSPPIEPLHIVRVNEPRAPIAPWTDLRRKLSGTDGSRKGPRMDTHPPSIRGLSPPIEMSRSGGEAGAGLDQPLPAQVDHHVDSRVDADRRAIGAIPGELHIEVNLAGADLDHPPVVP